jgi:glycosyltransferase involved in cell wall biosynthesis
VPDDSTVSDGTGSILYTSLLESSGYAHAALRNMDALSRAGCTLAWSPLSRSPHGYDPAVRAAAVTRECERLGLLEDDPAWSAALARLPPSDAAGAGTNVAPCTSIVHTVPEYWSRVPRTGGPTVGFTVWETDRLPRHWDPLLRAVDHVAVPDRHSLSLVSEVVGEARASRVPHPMREPQTPGDAAIERFRERYGIPRDTFVFYSIGAWTARKAPWTALHAYLLAFDADDPVVFVLKTGPLGGVGDLTGQPRPTHSLVREIVADYPDPARVCLINHEIPRSDLDCLHAVGDCYLSLVRGEGWGLGAFDAATAGCPVIATGWGGHLDYLDPADAWLVDSRLVPVRDNLGARSYSRDQRWAEPDLDHTIERLRYAVGHTDEGRARGRRLRERIRAEFAPGVVGAGLRRAARV